MVNTNELAMAPAWSRGGPISQAVTYVAAALRRDFRAFSFTLLGCGLSATVAVFQFAVFTSFLAAATVAPRLIDGDVWVGDYGVQCFDLPSSIDDAYAASLLRYFPGASFRRVYVNFAPYLSPAGKRGVVALIGVDGLGLPPASFTADADELAHLDLAAGDGRAEIAGQSQAFVATDIRLSSFLGTPYTLMNGADAANALRMSPDRVSFVVFDAPKGGRSSLEAGLRAARAANPELMILSQRAFVFSTGYYWLMRTGGGAAILMACILASVLMAVFLINGVARFVQRRHGDLMTLLGLGGSRADINRILLLVALLFSFGGAGFALVAAPVLRLLAHPLVPWVTIGPPVWVFALTMAAICMALGANAAATEVRRLPLAEIFRT